MYNQNISSKALSFILLLSYVHLSATSITTLSDYLNAHGWSITDATGQVVSKSSYEKSHELHFDVKFDLDDLPAENQAEYTKILRPNPTVNHVASAIINKPISAPGGERLTIRRDLTNEQKSIIFKAALKHLVLGIYEQKWDEFYGGPRIHPNAVYIADGSSYYVGKKEILSAMGKKTKLFAVDNSNASESKVKNFLSSSKKSQMIFELFNFTMRDNVVSISVSNVLNTAKIKPSDTEGSFLNTTTHYWDIDENNEPYIFLFLDTLDLASSGTRILSWLTKDTLEGGNALRRAGKEALNYLKNR